LIVPTPFRKMAAFCKREYPCHVNQNKVTQSPKKTCAARAVKRHDMRILQGGDILSLFGCYMNKEKHVVRKNTPSRYRIVWATRWQGDRLSVRRTSLCMHTHWYMRIIMSYPFLCKSTPPLVRCSGQNPSARLRQSPKRVILHWCINREQRRT
jgi:hypothetical protein